MQILPQQVHFYAYPISAARIQSGVFSDHVYVCGVHQGIVKLRIVYRPKEGTLAFTGAVVVNHVVRKSYRIHIAAKRQCRINNSNLC